MKVNEGTCGYGEDGELGDEPAGPHLLKRKNESVGSKKYNGRDWFWPHDYRHYLRDASPAQRKKIHDAWLKIGIPVKGTGLKISDRYLEPKKNQLKKAWTIVRKVVAPKELGMPIPESVNEAMSEPQRFKVYNSLKKGDIVSIKYDSSIQKGSKYIPYIVTKGKTKLMKGKIERIILKNPSNPRFKAYLYNRDGDVSLALGDMAASIVDMKKGKVKESVDERLKKGQKIIAVNPKDKTLKGKDGVIYDVGIGNSTSYMVQVGKGKKTRFAIMTDKEIKLKESVDERIPAGKQKLVYQFKKLSTSQMDELDAMLSRAGIVGTPDFNKMIYTIHSPKKSVYLDYYIKTKYKKFKPKRIKEGFGGELKGSDKKKFENDRKKNGEQLGYTLTGESDVKKTLQRVVKEEVFNILEDKDIGHQDDEPDMLKKTALEITEYGKKLHDALDKYDNMDTEVDFPNWWQSKLILSKDYLQKAYHYLDSEEKTESVNERMDKRQAGETLKQLGGNKFIAMTGAKNFAVGPKGMGFKIGRNSKSINYIRIDLKSNDLYDMEFIRLRKSQIKVVKRVTGVYNDQLQKMFTKYTGMYTSL